MQRLNAKRSQPNAHIVFLKPLKGPDERTAQDFLERVAAQCLPVMRDNSLSVMTLEEFEPNREFVGRNFNAGEVIQLVLKAPGSGCWLPFGYVQMVMMHELAHCKQMNHSRAFWAVRNQYAAQMRGLWARGYTGDGLWGRGASLSTGEWESKTVRTTEGLPQHLCGGTYRSRGTKRKSRRRPTYQERKERRVRNKFGRNGTALGPDEEVKTKLEKGKRNAAKPRVAASARGRELRAAAAMSRFEQQKSESDSAEAKKEGKAATSSDSALEDSGASDSEAVDAIDVDGSRLQDGSGRGMVKVCEDEDQDQDQDGAEARHELDELQAVFRRAGSTPKGEAAGSAQRTPGSASSAAKTGPVKDQAAQQEARLREQGVAPRRGSSSAGAGQLGAEPRSAPGLGGGPKPAASFRHSDAPECAMCSFANRVDAVTCAMCANVLDPGETRNSWRCGRGSCRGSEYVNAGDCGVCGVCGQRRG